MDTTSTNLKPGIDFVLYDKTGNPGRFGLVFRAPSLQVVPLELHALQANWQG